MYKIAFVGLGSIAKRHLKNVPFLLHEREKQFSIDLLRHSEKRCEKTDSFEYEVLIDRVYYSADDMPIDYDIIFITNPTHLHFKTIKELAHHTKHMFIEKPVFDKWDYNVDSLHLNPNGHYYVACPLRYTSVIQYLRHFIDLRTVFSVRAICSSYLPHWRPNQDYRETYSSHLDQGGGVSIDLIHEWDYLIYLFGIPAKIYNLRGKYSDLEIDSEDLSVYIARTDERLIELHLDYFGRKSIRELQLFTKDDTIVADIQNHKILFSRSGDVIELPEDRNDMYIKELEHFFAIIEGYSENDNTIEQAIQVLKIAQEGN